MKPVTFPEQTVVYAANQPEYQPLPAHRIPDSPEGEIITCWELSPEEASELIWSRRLYIRVCTFGQPLQPILPQIESPWEPAGSFGAERPAPEPETLEMPSNNAIHPDPDAGRIHPDKETPHG